MKKRSNIPIDQNEIMGLLSFGTGSPEVAAMLGVSRITVWRWKNCKLPIPDEYRKVILHCLSVKYPEISPYIPLEDRFPNLDELCTEKDDTEKLIKALKAHKEKPEPKSVQGKVVGDRLWDERCRPRGCVKGAFRWVEKSEQLEKDRDLPDSAFDPEIEANWTKGYAEKGKGTHVKNTPTPIESTLQ